MSRGKFIDKDRLTGIVVLVLIFVGYQFYMSRHPPQKPVPKPGGSNAPMALVAAPTGAQEQAEAQPATPAQPAVSAQAVVEPFAVVPLAAPQPEALPSFVLSNELATYTFSAFGGDLSSIELARTPLVRKGPIRVSCAASNGWEVPLRIRSVGGLDMNTLAMAPAKMTATELVFTGMLDHTVLVTKHYRLDANYLLRASVAFQNNGKTPLNVSNQFTVWLGRIDHATSIQDPRGSTVCLVQNGIRRVVAQEPTKKDGNVTIAGPAEWFAVRNKYFTNILIPGTNADAVVVDSLGTNAERLVSTYASFPLPELAPGGTHEWQATLFTGPKAYELLQALPGHVGHGGSYTDIINFGWFSIIAKPILVYGLKGLFKYVHSYGIAIIILTIIVKVLTWPLQTKSYQSMQGMQKLKPEMDKLQVKYKGDPQQLHQEQILLYRKHGINPLGGCLPMVLQIPIFIALYQALWNAVELWGAPFLWIKDLSLPDTVYTLPFKIPFLGDGVHPLPLLMTAATIGQQLMTPATGDKSQQQMMYMMPVMFLFIFYNMPSGLVLYWFVNQLLSMGQTFYLHYMKEAK